ncbi:hydrolytic protein [Streptomyces sp. NBC_01463]|uniref:COG1470 family protein n=1 Tax=unclassified Streptomyces TaxID=2593676 RepID=UPI002552273D|nr:MULTISPECIES: hydrolytic protein [unclassified Streptomyces]WRZ69982.1 hydrolytic protein [Streptomyces sp. NBC_01257]WSU63845.1 hydrolytic protein [Streptomyces sp. NBC_01104]
MATVTVSPGAGATTTLTVRNDGDIVEAYTLEVVGDCAAWATVEPARVSLYPGTSETVTVRLAPPRSHEVAAGEVPLGVRVLPAEHPESVAVPEATVVVEPFHELRTKLEPGRRRGWLGARFRTSVQNRGNTPVDVVFGGKQAGEELRLAFAPERRSLKPGESADAGLRVRARKLIWFGAPVTWPFEAAVAESEGAGAEGEQRERPEPLPGEFAQLPLLPKWLLIVLAALIALLLAWFALVRPAVRSTAKEAGAKAAQEENRQTPQGGAAAGGATGGGTGGAQGEGQGQTAGTGQTGSGGAADGGSGSTGGGTANTQQSSETIDVQTGAGAKKDGTYRVPEGKVFGVTDIVVANFQGDEGVLTISFGERKITTIALETFRNQDYHWVTPIRIPENAAVTASVTCSKPGTPATGTQASECHQVLNVSGVLSDIAP